MRDVRKEVSLQPAISPHTSLAIAAHLVANGSSPSLALSRVEKISVLEKSLNKMEPLDREVIALRHFEELSNSEVAQVLDINIQAASKRYVRAIQRMKQILAQVDGYGNEGQS